MFRLLRNSVWLALCLPALAAPPLRRTPDFPAPADQLAVAGNACGPAALLNSFQSGSASWRRASDALSGDSAKQKIHTIIREYGMRPSKSIQGRPRWSRKGVNLADLCDIANEMARGLSLPLVRQEILLAAARESPEKLLRRTHARLETSLAKGFPPVISLRRYVFRRENGHTAWTVLDAHFVTVIAVPRRLDKRAVSFPVTCIDPWGGKVREGSIAIATRPLLAGSAAASPCLEADFHGISVGAKKLRPGEDGPIAVAAALGRW
jgi:hypothetical protein